MYRITEDKVEYIGKQGENGTPILDKSNITITYSPYLEEWTDQDVIVSLSTSSEIEEKYELQYSLNNTTWFKYRNRNNDDREWGCLCKIS